MEFLSIINNLNNKIIRFGYLRYGPDSEIWEKIDKDPINELKFHLKTELKYFCELFSINEDCALVLSTFLLTYKLHNNVELYFISNDSLTATLGSNILEFYSLNFAICELQWKKVIKVKDFDYHLNDWIKRIQNLEHYYEVQETAFIATDIKTYQLTETFINKIINL